MVTCLYLKNSNDVIINVSPPTQWVVCCYAFVWCLLLQEKEQFVTSKLKRKSSREGSDVNLTAEEMSVFYKGFLDANYNLHKAYNRYGYCRFVCVPDN